MPMADATSSSSTKFLRAERLYKNRFGRRILALALGRSNQSVSIDELKVFEDDPQGHGPYTEDEHLDLNGQTLKSMRESPWNRMLAFRLAKKTIASPLLQNYSLDIRHINMNEWVKFFSRRIQARIRNSPQAKEFGKQDTDGLQGKGEKKDDRRWGALNRKLNDRRTTAGVMQKNCRTAGDKGGEEYWAYVFRSVEEFQAAGMSDEEDGWKDGEEVKFVHQLDWRDPDYDCIFARVDHIRVEMSSPAGRKRKLRVPSGWILEQEPPSGVSRQRFRSGYLDAREAAGKAYTEFGRGDYPASRYG
ncbi:hypothetical protein PM082_015307 [Marasmius tenuissimus]|nr:hypothetical protein PM082_015307 [Marasmius tenuissimus]